MRKNRPALFRGRHFEDIIIVLCVRWYLRYSLSYRDLEEMMLERGLSVDHTTVWRWVQRYAPELNKRIRREVKSTNGSWRTDETYVRVAGRWTYLYRAVDSTGSTIDFLLSETRDLEAARRFFQKALAAPGHPRPRVITVDGNPSYPTVIQELKRAGRVDRRSLSSDESTPNSASGLLIQGYEAIHMIRKGQVRWLPKGDVVEQVQFINATLNDLNRYSCIRKPLRLSNGLPR